MTTFEKIVKYAATAFAALLAVGIVITILEFGFHSISSIVGSHADLTDTSAAFETDEIESVKINNNVADINISTTTGSEIVVEGKDVFETFICQINKKGQLEINNKGAKSAFFSMFNKSPKITVYIPENFNIKELTFECGVGDIDADGLDIDKLIINGGVGDIKLTDCNIKNGELDGGVGDIDFSDCTLLDASIDNGVGDIDLNLNGDIDDYCFDTDNGIGTIRINGVKADSYPKSDGKYEIECDNGVGDIKININ